MSFLSENLDCFDKRIFDSLAVPENKPPCSFSPRSKSEMTNDSQAEEGGENDVEDEEESETGNGSWKAGTKRLVLGEKTPESFRSSLWSNNESTIERSLDSWSLPMGPVPWDENDKPIQKLLSYADLTLTEEEENGFLTDRIIAACSSYLTESPGNKCHIVAKVSLNNKNLNDIRILGCHRFLQYVDLSWNNLCDLTPLGCLPYLMYLDVSHNLLEEVLRFMPPLNLTYVNYSYNEIWQIDDLTDFWALCYLDLSHNKISKIQGFHNLRYLRHLDLSHNKIERLENLNGLRITDLNLEYNLISRFEMEDGLGLKTMPHLTNLYLNNNLITNLDFIEDAYSLKKLELQSNNVSDLLELMHMKCLKNLRYLDMSGNPVSELKPYRNQLLNFLQDLKFLDQTEVDISERVAACKRNRFDVQLEAARNNARMILLEQLNATLLNTEILPVDQGPYPFVIIVGPSGSSKKTIIVMLQEKYPDKIYVGKLHTTREVFGSEQNLFVHLPREDFNDAIKDGKFLCVSENLGHMYGFSKQELGTAIKNHKLCLVALDMVSALTIHSYGIQPFMVIALPQSREEHMSRLKEIYGPVLCTLGATYVSQKQQINTHESNVKRVQNIIDDLLEGVLKKVHAEYAVPESGEETLSSSKSFNLELFGGQSSESESAFDKNQLDFYSFPITRGGYRCSPTQCGYQAAKNDFGSLIHKTDERLSASLVETRGERTTTTSYSTTKPPHTKIDYSTSEENSFEEEEDPFVNWSMPFIDWSEINVNQLDLEMAAEVICNKYIENVMSTSDVYQNLHLENPGLFSLSISTDDVDEAAKEIGKFLKEIWRSTPNRKPIFDLTEDLVYQEYVPRKLEQLKEMLRKDFLSADGDGTLKGLNDVAPINSPTAICAEMRLKGYGDFSENL